MGYGPVHSMEVHLQSLVDARGAVRPHSNCHRAADAGLAPDIVTAVISSSTDSPRRRARARVARHGLADPRRAAGRHARGCRRAGYGCRRLLNTHPGITSRKLVRCNRWRLETLHERAADSAHRRRVPCAATLVRPRDAVNGAQSVLSTLTVLTALGPPITRAAACGRVESKLFESGAPPPVATHSVAARGGVCRAGLAGGLPRSTRTPGRARARGPWRPAPRRRERALRVCSTFECLASRHEMVNWDLQYGV